MSNIINTGVDPSADGSQRHGQPQQQGQSASKNNILANDDIAVAPPPNAAACNNSMDISPRKSCGGIGEGGNNNNSGVGYASVGVGGVSAAVSSIMHQPTTTDASHSQASSAPIANSSMVGNGQQP